MTQALLAGVSYQLLSDACEAVGATGALENFPTRWCAIDHISSKRCGRTRWCSKFLSTIPPSGRGLDQIEASREAELLMRKLLNVADQPGMAGRTEREIHQRITALGSMCMFRCAIPACWRQAR